jgi:hypothetical protein
MDKPPTQSAQAASLDALIAEARTWFPECGPNERSMITRLADALESLHTTTNPENDIRAAIAHWWNDGPRKTWRDDFEDPARRDAWFHDLAAIITSRQLTIHKTSDTPIEEQIEIVPSHNLEGHRG